MEPSFNIGDRVRLREDSDYYPEQIASITGDRGIAIVVALIDYDETEVDEYIYEISFNLNNPNMYTNRYRSIDLRLADNNEVNNQMPQKPKLKQEKEHMLNLLLRIFEDIDPYQYGGTGKFSNQYIGGAHGRFNYERDYDNHNMKCYILYENKKIALLTFRPHKSIAIRKQFGYLKIYQNILENALRETRPFIKINYVSRLGK
jgi:hypothetical protein